MYNPNQNSKQQKILQLKADYSNYNTKSNLGNPKNGNIQFTPTQNAYNTPKYMSHDLPMQFSDEHIFNENTRTVSKKMLRKKKIWISDKNKDESGNNPEDFAVIIQDKFKEVRSIKVIQVIADYTAADATEILYGVIYFPDFSHSEKSTNGQLYHAIFPVTQGSNGSVIRFNYSFPDTYISDFKQLTELNSRLRVQILYEDTTGKFVPFTSLNRVGVELEITTIDFSEKENFTIKS